MAPASDRTGTVNVQAVVVITCTTLAWYNALELLVLIFTSFKFYKGLYFWSLLVAGFAILPYGLGFLMFYFHLTHNWIAFIIVTYGWVTMVTGQSVVLYSRLHFVTQNERLLKAVKWMIIANAVAFHIPTTVMLFGSNLKPGHHPWHRAYKIYEKLQMTGFCTQESVISGIYLWETVRLLKILSKRSARRIIQQLFIINIIIMGLDVVLLSIEYCNLSVLEQTTKGVVYSIKLKFEFAILGKLVEAVESDRQGMGSTMADATAVQDPSVIERYRFRSTAVGLEKNTFQPESSQIAVEHRETVTSCDFRSGPQDEVHKDTCNWSATRQSPEAKTAQSNLENSTQDVSSVEIEYAAYLRQASR